MAARSTKMSTVKVESHEASSTLVGLAFAMPEQAARALAFTEEAPIDFQARQDKISPDRRGPGPKLAPKLKRTATDPAKAKETKVKL